MKTESAEAAKAIRSELKKSFPDTKFSVTSDSFAMGNAVRIKWTDGQTCEAIEAIINKYQYGSVNCMEDIYENTNTRNDIPQVKYVQTSREMSEEAKEAIICQLYKTILDFTPERFMPNYQCYGSVLIYREFRKLTF